MILSWSFHLKEEIIRSDLKIFNNVKQEIASSYLNNSIKNKKLQ